MLTLTTQEQHLHGEFCEALASGALPEVLPQAFDPLQRLIAMDHGAVCVSRIGVTDDYDWFSPDLPAGLFADYARAVKHDFVRRKALEHPGRALRDDEMLPYREIERSVLHRSFCKQGIVLGQIMTVQVPIQGEAHGGLTLYRTRRRAFTDRDRALLQLLAPMLASVLRSHHFLGEAARRGAALEALLGHQGGAAVCFCPPATELWRTAEVTPLLSRWFSPADLLGGGLPRPLLDELRRATAAPDGAPPPKPWVREREGVDLRVSLIRVPQSGPSLWLMVLKQVPHAIPMPPDWTAPPMPPKRRLAPREREVAGCVLEGWDNETIAGHLMCSLATVKKHLVRVFNKLGVGSRAQLVNKAYREQP